MSLFGNIVRGVLNEATNVKKLYKTFNTLDKDVIDMIVRLCPDTNINTNPNTGEEFVMVNKIGIWLLNEVKRSPYIYDDITSNSGIHDWTIRYLDIYSSLPQNFKSDYGILDLSSFRFYDFISKMYSLDEKNLFKEVEEERGKTKFENIVNKLKVYEDDKWIVCKVTSYEDDKIIGGGTTWCTASDENGRYNGREMYNNYTKYGANPLWVVIRRDGNFTKDENGKYEYDDCMYQLAFEFDNYGGMFCDASDYPVNLHDLFGEENGLLDFFKKNLDERAFEAFYDIEELRKKWFNTVLSNAKHILNGDGAECFLMQNHIYERGNVIANDDDCKFYVYRFNRWGGMNVISNTRHTKNCIVKKWGEDCALIYNGSYDCGNDYSFVLIDDDNSVFMLEDVSHCMDIDGIAILLFHYSGGDTCAIFSRESKRYIQIGEAKSKDVKVIYKKAPNSYYIQFYDEEDKTYSLYSYKKNDFIIWHKIPANGSEFVIEDINGTMGIRCKNESYDINGNIIMWRDINLSSLEHIEGISSNSVYLAKTENGQLYAIDAKDGDLIVESEVKEYHKVANFAVVTFVDDSVFLVINKYGNFSVYVNLTDKNDGSYPYYPVRVEYFNGDFNYLDADGDDILMTNVRYANDEWEKTNFHGDIEIYTQVVNQKGKLYTINKYGDFVLNGKTPFYNGYGYCVENGYLHILSYNGDVMFNMPEKDFKISVNDNNFVIYQESDSVNGHEPRIFGIFDTKIGMLRRQNKPSESQSIQPSVAERRNHVGGLLIERIEKLIKDLNKGLIY